MSGCGQDYSSLSLSFDLNNSSKIELSVGDEAKEYFVKIENYYEFDPVFTFSFAEDVATVKSYQKATNDGVYKFSITPLRPGETTLSLDLSGLNKPLKIPVRVTNDIVGFAPTNQIYATRGNTLQLNSSLFTFTPPDTSQTGLNFDLKTVFDGLTLDSNTNTLTVPANYTAAEIVLNVTSKSNASIFEEITIKVVDPIDIQDFQVAYASQDITNPEDFAAQQDVVFDNQETPLVFTISEAHSFQKRFYVQADEQTWTKNYLVDITLENNQSTPNVFLIGGGVLQLKQQASDFDFTVVANDISSQGLLKFKFYQADYPDNCVEQIVYLKATCVPTAIKINGQDSLQPVELYTNSDDAKEYAFSVAPSKAQKDDYNYSFQFYSVTTNTAPEWQNIVSEANIKTQIPAALEVKYGGAKIVDCGNEYDLSNLNTILSLKALNFLPDTYFAIKITCFQQVDGVRTDLCENVIYFQHKTNTKIKVLSSNK